MSFRDNVKARVAKLYAHIEEEAQKEVALARQMPLKDKFDQKQFYTPRLVLREFTKESDELRKAGINVLPLEIMLVIFRCRLLRVVRDEQEFQQRSGAQSLFENQNLRPKWTDKATAFDNLEDQYVSTLEFDVKERTLVTPINSLNATKPGEPNHQDFFADLFSTLGLPLKSFVDVKAEEKEFFAAPSIGCTVTGTENYCFQHGIVWLRTFLNMLRIGAFIYPGQRDFFLNAKMEPPTFPVFLGRHAQGSYQWREDEKEPWQKFPDGCLFRSWGFRGLSNMWLDGRNRARVKEFMLVHKPIFDRLKNPWSDSNTQDVAPILDILSSATQIPDLGAKILLIYCCLEHLFVPSKVGMENKKYIIGGLNALRPQLSEWLDELYEQRCEYAHNGFVLRTDKTLALITESIKNVMTLLIAKLSVC
jgi:hypothetical protein